MAVRYWHWLLYKQTEDKYIITISGASPLHLSMTFKNVDTEQTTYIDFTDENDIETFNNIGGYFSVSNGVVIKYPKSLVVTTVNFKNIGRETSGSTTSYTHGTVDFSRADELINVTNINDAFSYTGMEKIIFGNNQFSNVSQADESFRYSSVLEKIDLSKTKLKKIGDYMFYKCSSLNDIKLPYGIITIGESSFAGSIGSLTHAATINIPSTVTTIGNDAFDDARIDKVYFDSLDHIFDISFGNSSSHLRPHHLYVNNQEILNLTIPSDVTTINEYMFIGCTGLTSVTIPNTVTKIKESAFNGCTGLTSVSIADTVTEIGASAFSGCSSLTSLVIPDSVSVGRAAFTNCTNLTSVVLGDSVTLDWYAIDCSNITYLKVGKNCTKWENAASNNLQTLELNTNPTSFTNNSMTTLILGDNISNIPNGNMTMTNLTNIYCDSNNSTYTVKNNMLYQNTNLICVPAKHSQSVTIPSDVSYITGYSFQGDYIQEITFNHSLTVGGGAFALLTNLNSIKIGQSVQLTGLKYAYLSFIKDDIKYSLISNTDVAVIIKNNNPTTYNGASTYSGVINIPSTVTLNNVTFNVVEISSRAFYDRNSYIDSITIALSITTIANNAFYRIKKSKITNLSDFSSLANYPFGAVD